MLRSIFFRSQTLFALAVMIPTSSQAGVAVLERPGKPPLALSSASGGRSQTEVVEHVIVGPNGSSMVRKIPGSLQWLNVEIERPIDKRLDLWEWRGIVTGQAPQTARETVTLRYLDSDGIEVQRQRLIAAWPASIRADFSNSISLSETAVLTHEGSSLSVDPNVQITMPIAGTILWNPASIVVRASPESPQLVGKIQFYAGANLVGSDNVPESGNFEVSWPNPPAGDHVLSAIATDGAGETYSSLNQVPVSIRIGLTYEQWRQNSGFFNSSERTNVLVSGPFADPDHDGAPNLSEYAANRNPLDGSESPEIQLIRDGQGLLLRYRRRLGGDATGLSYYRYSDIAYIIESSTDLQAWTQAAGLFTEVTLLADNGGQTELVSARLKNDSAAAGVYLRLRIQQLLSP